MNMLRFEIKKVFSTFNHKAAVALLLFLLMVVSMLTANRVEYVDKNGDHQSGISAARNLRAEKNKWAGYLTEEVFQQVVRENAAIKGSPEARSEDIQEQDKAYAKGQSFSSIADLINNAFSQWRDYNYYAIDNVSADKVKEVYEKRITTLKEWLDSGEEQFTEPQKAFLIKQYEDLDTPFYYVYFDGWSALLQNISTFILILALIIGFLVSGIFSGEFQKKADAIFFSTELGRSKGITAKIGAGLLITTVLYFVCMLLHTGIVLFVLGADGASCPIQLDLWRSVYNITFVEAWLLIIAGGYVGTVFAATLAMLVSAATRSTVIATIVPFIILCAFPFLSRIITLPQVCAFFPDQLLEVYIDIKEAGLVTLGKQVMPVAAVIVPIYLAACLLLQPVLYRIYSKR